jgi:hypothetical protein
MIDLLQILTLQEIYRLCGIDTGILDNVTIKS